MNILYKWKKQIIGYAVLCFCLFASLIFINHNDSYYKRPIAKIINIKPVNQEDITDYYENQDVIYTQEIVGILLNGKDKGKLVQLENKYSYSGAMDYKYKVGDHLFVALKTDSDHKLSGTIKGLKRDKYIALLVVFYILFMIVVGKKQGIYSVMSLLFNIVLFSYIMDLYRKGINLLFVSSVAAIVFAVISLFLVSGNTKKTYAAIVATLICTFSSLSIVLIVMKLTKENGVRYEVMQFLTRPPHEILMAEILIGSLGAVMDVAITIASSIYELYVTDKNISNKALIGSAREIGKDIMGTMTNVLFFAYVSGAIPILLVYLKNQYQVFYSFNINLSLELIRGLAGSIGIVLTIPVSIYVTIFILGRSRQT